VVLEGCASPPPASRVTTAGNSADAGGQAVSSQARVSARSASAWPSHSRIFQVGGCQIHASKVCAGQVGAGQSCEGQVVAAENLILTGPRRDTR
jgi:hypothetical protein